MLGVNNGQSVVPPRLTPQQIGLWVDANNPFLNNTLPSNNTTMNSISDAGIYNFQLTQTTVGNQPTFITNSLNGKPGILFNGSSTFFSAPNNAVFNTVNSAGLTIIAVASPGSITNRRLLAACNGNLSLNQTGWVFGMLSTNKVDFSACAVNDYASSTGFWTANTAQISIMTYSSSFVVNFYKNGTFNSTATYTSGTLTTDGSLYIGCERIFNFWDGYLYELIAYFGVLSSSDITAISRWLGNKWGIQTV